MQLCTTHSPAKSPGLLLLLLLIKGILFAGKQTACLHVVHSALCSLLGIDWPYFGCGFGHCFQSLISSLCTQRIQLKSLLRLLSWPAVSLIACNCLVKANLLWCFGCAFGARLFACIAAVGGAKALRILNKNVSASDRVQQCVGRMMPTLHLGNNGVMVKLTRSQAHI